MQTRGAAFSLGHLIARSRANKAASACSPASLPPVSSYMTSSLGHAEVPQAVLLTICSRSPVSHVISAHKTLFMSRVHHIYSYLHAFFPFESKLTTVFRTLFHLDFFFLIIEFSAQCVFFILTHNLSFLYLTISLRFLWFSATTSLFYSCLTLTALFFSSISICHVCVSVPILFLPSIPRGSLIQRLQSSLPQQHFCCSQAVSCCFVMFGGQSSFEVLSSLLEKGKASLCAYGGWGVEQPFVCFLNCMKQYIVDRRGYY